MTLSSNSTSRFTSSPIATIRASSFIPVLEDSSDGRSSLPLTKDQSAKLLDFLEKYSVDTDCPDLTGEKISREDGLRINLDRLEDKDLVSARECENAPNLVMLYPKLVLRRAIAARVSASRVEGALISWIELKDVSRAALKDKPRKFTFVLHRDLVSKNGRGDFKRVEVSRIEFMHSFVGRGSRPTLNFRCDLATLRQNPAVRNIYEQRGWVKDEDQLATLLEFFLHPVKELIRVSEGRLCNLRLQRGEASNSQYGNLYTYEGYSLRFKKITRQVGFDPDTFFENPCIKVPYLGPKAKKSSRIFLAEDFTLDKNFSAPALKIIRVESLTFAFQSTLPVVLNKEEPPITKKQESVRIHDTLNQMVALFGAVFSRKRWYADGYSTFPNIAVEIDTADVSSIWKKESDEALLRMAGSQKASKVQSVSLRIFRPVHKHNLYTVRFRTYDPKRVTAQRLSGYGEYAYLRREFNEKHNKDMDSAVQSSDTLNRSLEMSVTVHHRVLSHDFGIQFVEDLKNKIFTSDPTNMGKSVHDFYHEAIRRALSTSGIFYWCSSRSWMTTSHLSADKFQSMLQSAVAGQQIRPGHFETVSSERWTELASLIASVFEGKPYAKKLHSLFETGVQYDTSKNKITRITHVPEIATVFFILWFTRGSETLNDLADLSDVLPKEWKAHLLNPNFDVADEKSKHRIVTRLLDEVQGYVLRNFGIDMNKSRDFHKDVFQVISDVLTTKRNTDGTFSEERQKSSVAPVAPVNIEGVLSHSCLFYTIDLLRGFRNQTIFQKAIQ